MMGAVNMIELRTWGEQLKGILKSPNVLKRYRGVCLYQNRIKGDCGDVLECFNDLRKEVHLNSLSFDEWYNNILNNPTSNLLECVKLLWSNGGNIKAFDRDEKFYQEMLETMKRAKQAWANRANQNQANEPEPQWLELSMYSKLKDTKEYKLMRGVNDYLDKIELGKPPLIDTWHSTFEGAVLAEMLFLYVALENEQENIKGDAYVEGVELSQAPVKGIKAHTGEEKQQGCGNTPPDGEKTLKQQFYEALKKEEQKDRANKCFAQAIKEGVMMETATGYKWLYWIDKVGNPKRGNKARLGYFLHSVLNHKRNSRIPYEILNKLFEVERLDTTIEKAINPKSGEPQKWRADIDLLIERALS